MIRISKRHQRKKAIKKQNVPSSVDRKWGRKLKSGQNVEGTL